MCSQVPLVPEDRHSRPDPPALRERGVAFRAGVAGASCGQRGKRAWQIAPNPALSVPATWETQGRQGALAQRDRRSTCTREPATILSFSDKESKDPRVCPEPSRSRRDNSL